MASAVRDESIAHCGAMCGEAFPGNRDVFLALCSDCNIASSTATTLNNRSDARRSWNLKSGETLWVE